MKRFSRRITSPILCVLALTTLSLATQAAPRRAAPGEQTVNVPTQNPRASLERYQAALDQLAQGHLIEARVMLLDALARFGEQPELRLLLGYVLHREGRTAQARSELLRVAPSILADEYARQLQNAPTQSTLSAPAATTAPGAPAASATRLPNSDARLANLEKFLMNAVNTERTRAGLTTLEWDDELADIARAHSAEMRDKKYFAHESPTPELRHPLGRFRAAGRRTPRTIAENIYAAWGDQHRLSGEDMKRAHSALMNSPGHRANLMLHNISRIGIGLVANATGDIWLTQLFLRP